MTKKYGKIKQEQRLEQAIAAREINKTIIDYGVSQYQIAKIIYLLSLELENRDAADGILAVVKELLGEEESSEQENNEIIMR